ncbi:MAG: hypothetical protein ACREIE_07570 [Nitrospiraceae bacterium]
MIQVEAKAQIQWAHYRSRRGKWIAVCDPLGITLQSDKFSDLVEDMAHALNALLKDLLQEGELERFLRDRGWSLTGPTPAAPDDVWFDVPFATRAAERDPEVAVH